MKFKSKIYPLTGIRLFTLLLAVLFLSHSAYGWGDSPNNKEIGQYGITWTFAQPLDKIGSDSYTCGQFHNGDYWVVGPVIINGIDPISTNVAGRIANGSMRNPSPSDGDFQGYDNGNTAIGTYSTALNVAYNVSVGSPLPVAVNSSIVSTISVAGTNQWPQLQTAAVLTILSTVPETGSFRPPYCGTDKSIKYNISDMDNSSLAEITPEATLPVLATLEDRIKRIQLEHVPGWHSERLHPSDNMAQYSGLMSSEHGEIALVLNSKLDADEATSKAMKATLLAYMVQIGLDWYAVVSGPGGRLMFPGDGGNNAGHKFPIIFAGSILHDADILSIADKSGDYLYSGNHGPNKYGSMAGNIPPDYIFFAEDDQTFYVKACDTGLPGVGTPGDETGDIFVPLTTNPDVYVEHVYGSWTYYGHGDVAHRTENIEYVTEDLGLPEWGIKHAYWSIQDNPDWVSANYRQSSTAYYWAGWALAMHAMGIKDGYNHNAFFDYQDRYMAEMLSRVGHNGLHRQQSDYAEDMWDSHRTDYPPVWTYESHRGNTNVDQTFYVTENGAGNRSGLDWNNAYAQLPANLERGHIYYISDGSYDGYTFNDPENDGNFIYIKKAVQTDHGTNAGWLPEYGDGIAEFGPLRFDSDDYIFDGQHKYGFKVVGTYTGQAVNVNSDYIFISNSDIDGNFQTNANGFHIDGSCNVIFIFGSHVTLENCNIHNAADDGIGVFGNNIKIIGNEIHNLHGYGTDGNTGPCNNGHSDAFELQDCADIEIIGNLVYDINSTSALITGQWSAGNYTRNLTLYNNIFYTPDTGMSVYIYYVQGAHIYNNVFWGRTQGSSYGGLAIGPEVTDLYVQNNIILNINYTHLGGTYDPLNHHIDYNLFGMIAASQYTANTHDIVGDPLFKNIPMSSEISAHLTNVVIDNFALQPNSPATNQGMDLSAQVQETSDIIGTPRLQGEWDIGSLEYIGAPTADAGVDQTVTDTDNNGSEQVTLDGSGSSDPDGTIQTYVWREGLNQVASGINPTITLSTGSHIITLDVVYDDDLTDFDTVIITVTAQVDNTNPIGWWKLDELTGDVATDSSNNGNPGTLHGGPQWEPQEGLRFDGEGDYVDCGSNDSLNITDSITISAWVKPAATMPSEAGIVAKQSTSTGEAYGLIYRQGNLGLRARIGGTWNTTYFTQNPEPDVWTYLVATYDGSTVRVYKNDILDNSTSITGSIGLSDYSLTIGRQWNSWSAFFHGSIKDVRVYNRALEANEILDLYSDVTAVSTYSVTASAQTGGSIVPNGTLQLADGDNLAFTITPATGYHVANVLVDGSSVGAVGSYTFANIADNHTISATFAVTQVTHTIQASAGIGGSISPSGTTTIDQGQDQLFTITPLAPFYTTDVLVDGSSVGNVDSYSLSNITSSHTISATFGLKAFSISGRWKFNEYSALSANDSTINNEPASINKLTGPTWAESGAVILDGGVDYVDCGSGANLNLSGDLTLSAWIYPESFGDGGLGRIVDKHGNLSGYAFYVKDDINGIAYLTYAGSYINSDENAINLNEWQHVAVAYSDTSDTVAFYVNGVPVGGGNYQTNPNDSAGARFIIGNRSDLDYGFDGMISDVRVYSRALTAQEISDIHLAYDVIENKPILFELSSESVASVQNPGALPSGAAFENNIFYWRPWYNQSGSYNVTFEFSNQPDYTVPLIVENVTPKNWTQLFIDEAFERGYGK